MMTLQHFLQSCLGQHVMALGSRERNGSVRESDAKRDREREREWSAEREADMEEEEEKEEEEAAGMEGEKRAVKREAC